jgi:hypothetical protein
VNGTEVTYCPSCVGVSYNKIFSTGKGMGSKKNVQKFSIILAKASKSCATNNIQNNFLK